jgi:hypothetical protein
VFRGYPRRGPPLRGRTRRRRRTSGRPVLRRRTGPPCRGSLPRVRPARDGPAGVALTGQWFRDSRAPCAPRWPGGDVALLWVTPRAPDAGDSAGTLGAGRWAGRDLERCGRGPARRRGRRDDAPLTRPLFRPW